MRRDRELRDPPDVPGAIAAGRHVQDSGGFRGQANHADTRLTANPHQTLELGELEHLREDRIVRRLPRQIRMQTNRFTQWDQRLQGLSGLGVSLR